MRHEAPRFRMAVGAVVSLVGVLAPRSANGATEFICKIKASGGDYASLSAWEDAGE